MQEKSKHEELKLDWVGFFALLIGIGMPMTLLEIPSIQLWLQVFFIVIFGFVLLAFIRRYNWSNIAVALMLLGTLYPVRFIFHWWINPIVYSVLGIFYLLSFIRTGRQYSWKHTVVVLMLICALLAGFQAAKSTLELERVMHF